MQVKINGKEYFYTNKVRLDTSIRHSFNELAKKVHWIDFEAWYLLGYWQDDYIPYVLMDGNKVVANVSVNTMWVNYINQKRLFVQLGTVMTDEHYRKQGLSRWLIEKILEEWKDKCDGLYLYANNTVLDFYPKFGFVNEQEYEAKAKINFVQAEIKKLNMDSESDRELLYGKYALTNQFSELTLTNNTGILMFYCGQFMKDNVYYLPIYDVAVVVEYDGEKMICYDIFGSTQATLQEILSAMAKQETKVCELGFAPKDKNNFQFEKLNVGDNTLFCWSKDENIFCNETTLRFPELSHA
ncbi:GNAT family N-acetyltransferase [Inconstantimicrobium mannanitabidum]|uniref:Acetyltransferase n=1 Tax=Inconstantimicrobium mannanitabidum TaxID=1604901 RepID=A0ACB5RCM7_9CLOT|nr:GNAT family N-acetyltransferase [Clostridium sp. TW13]GKX66496.1 acetyltransferase [Clostridium sp. TW13]